MVKHLGKSDACPTVEKEKLVLYLQKFCPFCNRVLMVIEYHKIPHEKVYIDLTDKPEWYLQKSPNGKVPLIEHGGQKMGDSDMICAFLDEQNPSSCLSANDTTESASAVKAFFAKIFQDFHKLLFEADHPAECASSVVEGMKELEKHIKLPYFNGPNLSLSDVLVYPIMDRIEAVFEFAGVSAADFPHLMAYVTAMRATELVKATSIPPDTHIKFCKSFRAGKIDFTIE